MQSICDMALNSAQEYCSNQYASWKSEKVKKVKKWNEKQLSFLMKNTQNKEKKQQKCEITVEPTVYYSRFMIYLCSATQIRDDKQAERAFDISRINNKTFRRCRVCLHVISILHIKIITIWWHKCFVFNSRYMQNRFYSTIKHTWSSFMATHELEGNPWSIGTKNCRHPLQWPMSNIIQIKLNMRINTDAMLRNYKKTRLKFIKICSYIFHCTCVSSSYQRKL